MRSAARNVEPDGARSDDGVGLARGRDELDDIALEFVVDVHGVRLGSPGADVVERGHGAHRLRVGDGEAVEDPQLLLPRRIADAHFHQEAVHLRDRQRVGALGVERIHRRHHDERIGQRVGLRADRHLPLLHRLQQGRLHLRGRAVDLVGQHDVGEDRSQHGRERALALVEDARADDVARQQVGRELDAFELSVERRRQRPAGQGFGEPGRPLQAARARWRGARAAARRSRRSARRSCAPSAARRSAGVRAIMRATPE